MSRQEGVATRTRKEEACREANERRAVTCTRIELPWRPFKKESKGIDASLVIWSFL
jgi:hypothetical protein